MACLPPLIKTHPLYPLRRALLFLAIPSFLFTIISLWGDNNYGRYRNKSPFVLHLVLATASALLNIYELARWGMAKFHDPGTQPKYPLKRILAADALLALSLFLFVFPAEIWAAGSTSCYGDPSDGVAQSYASMTCLVTLILHAICAWKQLMALKKKQWEKEVAQESGEIESEGDCGHYLRTRCPGCGAQGVWCSALNTSTSAGALHLATGYEIIPDKTPEEGSSTKSWKSKSKVASCRNSQTSLMEV